MLTCVFIVITLGYISLSTEACSTGEPDGTGVELIGTHYDCIYLRSYYPEDKFIGIYDSRKYHCRMPHTDCCQACNEVLSCNDAPVDGIYLAEMYFNCSFLQTYHPSDKNVGIYENRVSICKQTTTDCCETCENVFKEAMESTTTAEKETKTTTTPTRQSPTKTTPKELKDTCTIGCLWIGDGTAGTCRWLLDRSNTAYDVREELCSKGFTNGCEHTCHIIATESKASGKDSPVTPKTPTARPVCEDRFVVVDKDFYRCSDLLNPNSNVYNNRQAFCSSDKSACCVTCQRVINEKPSGVIKYTDQNQIGKNGIVVEQIPVAAQSIQLQSTNKKNPSESATRIPTTAQPAPNPFSSILQVLKETSERLQREEEQRRNAMKNFMSNIMSAFLRIQKTSNINMNLK